MEHHSTTPEKSTEINPKLAFLTENYGEKNTAELIAIFSAEHPNLTAEEVIDVVYDIDMKDMPRDTSWPDTTLDRVLLFR